MSKIDNIKHFIYKRPKPLSVYGYGSGVFKQGDYNGKVVDLIFIVDDLKDWHMENVKKNPTDYNFLGKLFVNTASLKRLKGHNKITYNTEVYDGEQQFKFGVMEEKDFITNLETWNNFFIPGRFQKPVIHLDGSSEYLEYIHKNFDGAKRVVALLSPEVLTREEFLKGICSLSYIGTLRMKIAENPKKIQNILDGSYATISSNYRLDTGYMYTRFDKVYINHEFLLNELDKFPKALRDYLKENVCDYSLEEYRKYTLKFLKNHNMYEEIHQSIHSFFTNGICKSSKYFTAKVKKKIMK